ncbi:unnamed protein product [Cyprideis torosa]|uniref:Uncharacterized protein n=1 Tax=Cyprideis torosa TaxID=163714 RepID=A0A7R8ZRK1_9CRUS|nr:unnamed protein product [Cyprideis torosa]CAG0904019.1 unnamed protein product [Cyprideis torosa]
MRETERALQLGTLFDANEALEIGLVDEIVQSNEEGLERAQEVLKEYMKVPSFARSMTKLQVRKPVIQKFGDGRDEDLETFCNFIPQKSVQRSRKLMKESPIVLMTDNYPQGKSSRIDEGNSNRIGEGTSSRMDEGKSSRIDEGNSNRIGEGTSSRIDEGKSNCIDEG